jgi:CheY-like chemotaxis protein
MTAATFVAMRVVLVVEDDADLLLVLSEALTVEGWTVLRARSASSALRRALSIHVDVVLTDLVMPNQDGRSLEDAFKADPILKEIPFVFMTAAIRRIRELRATRVLVKPFSLSDAVAMLKSCLPNGER